MILCRIIFFAMLCSPLCAEDTVGESNTVPPPFSETRLRYHVALGEAKEPLAQLDSFYESKLKELQARLQQQGNLEGVLAVKGEMDSFRKEPTEITDEHAELKKLQGIYLDAKTARSGPFLTTAIRMTRAYLDQLDAQVRALTQQGQVDDALLTKKEFDLAAAELKNLEAQSEALGNTSLTPLADSDEPHWETVEAIFAEEKFSDADTIAGQGGGSDYRDLSPAPGILVGIQLQYSQFNNFETVRGVLPIFLTERGRKETETIRGHKRGDPKRVIAKKGYAISELEVFSDNTAIRRAKITFARIAGEKLDLSDTYDSGWHGEYDTGAFSKTASDGRFVVGIQGVSGLGIGQVRFILGGGE